MKNVNMKIEYLGLTDKETLIEISKAVSIASRLSRSPMKVVELKEFVNKKTYEQNMEMIRKIVGYGHTALTELQYVIIGIQDVSIILEHFLISKRFTAFTIKSRRECDFQNEGFYLPTFHDKTGNVHRLNSHLQKLYQENVEKMFSTYGHFINLDIPYEEARYILPYSFPSNHIIGVTVHEICLIINDLLYGKISQMEEARILGKKLVSILLLVAPYMDLQVIDDQEMKNRIHTFLQENKSLFLDRFEEATKYELEFNEKLQEISMNPEKYSYSEMEKFLENIHLFASEIVKQDLKSDLNHLAARQFEKLVNHMEIYLLLTANDRVKLAYDYFAFLDQYSNDIKRHSMNFETRLLNYTQKGDEVAIYSFLSSRYQISYEEAKSNYKLLLEKDSEIGKKIIKGLALSPHERTLEQVSYQFSFVCPWALGTHVQRQRLQNLLVPQFFPIQNLELYDIPETIKNKPQEKQLFEETVLQNLSLYKYFKEKEVLESDLVYFYISGNLFLGTTTINARYLIHLSRLRTCLKAQKRIRKIVYDMCKEAKKVTPMIGEFLGPSCQVLGYCKEGKDNCQNKLVTTQSRVIKKSK